jgi:hypothetical protein
MNTTRYLTELNSELSEIFGISLGVIFTLSLLVYVKFLGYGHHNINIWSE